MVSQWKGIFDLPEAEGLNESERLLARMCKRSFLSLWSYPNLHTDRDFKDGKGSAKELSDLLMIFGDHVVIFSDKHVTFQTHKPIEVAWPRWYRSAVEASATQLYGAMSWLQKFPDRVFIDAKCTRRPPVRIPPPDKVRFHLVAVTRGSLQACAAHFPGSRGTLQIRSDLFGKEHLDAPFTVGRIDVSRRFVHVFDEFSLEVLLHELDTAPDFVEYLMKREALLTSSTAIWAAGEEQLLAAYLTNMVRDEHSFLPQLEGDDPPDAVVFDESHFDGLRARDEYARRKEADRQSYFWDHLIEKFIRIGDPALYHPEVQQSSSETEQALRALASESRFRRRNLVHALGDLFRTAAPGKRHVRMVQSPQAPDRLYIFLVQPKRESETYEEYRRHRAAFLYAYCRSAKLKFPDITDFIGIAVDHPVKNYEGVSEDLILFSCPEFTEEMRKEAEGYRQQLGILGEDMTINKYHDDEFPAPKKHPDNSFEVPLAASARQAADANKQQQLKKRRDKMAKASRRRNRAR